MREKKGVWQARRREGNKEVVVKEGPDKEGRGTVLET